MKTRDDAIVAVDRRAAHSYAEIRGSNLPRAPLGSAISVLIVCRKSSESQMLRLPMKQPMKVAGCKFAHRIARIPPQVSRGIRLKVFSLSFGVEKLPAELFVLFSSCFIHHTTINGSLLFEWKLPKRKPSTLVLLALFSACIEADASNRFPAKLGKARQSRNIVGAK